MKILFGKHKGTEYKDLPDSYAAWLLAEDVLKGDSKKQLMRALVLNKWKDLIEAWVEKNYKKKTYVPPVGCYSPDSDGMDYEPGYYTETTYCASDFGYDTDDDFMGTGGSCDWLVDADDVMQGVIPNSY